MGVADGFRIKPTPSAKRKRRESREGDGRHTVYFLSLYPGGMVKVGFTKSLRTRLANIAVDLGVHRDSIYVIGYLSVPMGSGRKVERAIHQALAGREREEEWFDVDGANLLDIAINAASCVEGDWSVHGLATDKTKRSNDEKWGTPAEKASHLIRRRIKWR